MQIQSVMFASPAYDEMVQLRINNLYIPLNADIDPENFASEYKDVHLGVYCSENGLIGALKARVLEENDEFLIRRKVALFKQIVIRKDLQRKGFGSKIFAELEDLLISKGYKEVRFQAHSGAVEFYEKLGFQKQGKVFKEEGIFQLIYRKKIQETSKKVELFEAVLNG